MGLSHLFCISCWHPFDLGWRSEQQNLTFVLSCFGVWLVCCGLLAVVGFSWSPCNLSVCDDRQFTAVGSVGCSLLGLAGLHLISVFVMIGSSVLLAQLDAACWV